MYLLKNKSPGAIDGYYLYKAHVLPERAVLYHP